MSELALYSHETEQALLALVMSTSQLDGVGAARLLLEREQLRDADFHLPAHASVYGAITTALAQSLPADPVTLWDRLRGFHSVTSLGGFSWLMELLQTSDAMLVHSFPGYARQIREYSIRRRLLSELRNAAAQAQDLNREIAEVLANAARGVTGITYRKDTFRTLTEVLEEVQAHVIRTQESTAPLRLVSTGIRALDGLIGGFPPMLIIIGARPGTGKSAMAATLTQNLAMSGERIGVFSLEDRAPWLAYRLVAGASGVSGHNIRFRKLTDGEYMKAGEGFSAAFGFADRVLIDDRRRMTGADVTTSARNMIVNHGVRAILIDHLLEVKAERVFARKDLEIVGQFRDLSNEYEVPVVVFTQLNRSAEGVEEPKMTHFKEAGSIDEMGRVVIAMSRKDDKIALCVIKNTNGKVGRVDVEFEGAAAMVANTEKQGSLYG
jgi:replicative DNA helicase